MKYSVITTYSDGSEPRFSTISNDELAVFLRGWAKKLEMEPECQVEFDLTDYSGDPYSMAISPVTDEAAFQTLSREMRDAMANSLVAVHMGGQS